VSWLTKIFGSKKDPDTVVLAANGKPIAGRRQYIATIDDRYLDYPISGLEPNTLVSAMRDADLGDVELWMELCEEMEDRDAQVAQCLYTRKAAVVACDYDVMPWRDYRRRDNKLPATAKDQEVADFVREVLFGLPSFEDRLLDLLDGIYKGFACLEINWKKGGRRRYTINDLIWVPQRKITFYNSEGGEPRLLTEQKSLEGVPLRGDWVFHMPRTRSIEPWRGGLARDLAWWFAFKHFTIRNWLVFMETHAHPLRLGIYPQGMSEADKANIYNALRRMSTDQAALVAEGTDGKSPIKIEYPQTSQASGTFMSFSEYADSQITKCILGQTLTSGADGKGSYALGKIHNDVRLTILAADADALSCTIRDQLIKPLVVYNYGKAFADRLPWFKIDYIPPEDMQKVATALGILSQQVGVSFSEKSIHERFGTDAPDGDEDATTPEPKAPPPGQPPAQEQPEQPEEMPEGEQTRKDGPCVCEMEMAERETGDPEDTVAGIPGVALPAAVKAAAKDYAAVVDGFNKLAFKNVVNRVTRRMIVRKKGWKDAQEFSDDFMKNFQRAWRQFYGDEGIDKETLRPFVEKIYKAYRLEDKSLLRDVDEDLPKYGKPDDDVVDFMARADKHALSTFPEKQSFDGPMRQWLEDEYDREGGELYSELYEEKIDKMNAEAAAAALALSRDETNKTIRTGLNRAKTWSAVVVMSAIGVTTARVVVQPDACKYCAQFDGISYSVTREISWLVNVVASSEAEFIDMMNDKTNATRAGLGAGVPPHDLIDMVGGPTYHPRCRCEVVVETV
jgi:phage gp29-like protein